MTADRSRNARHSAHGFGPTGARRVPDVPYRDERKLVTVLFADLAEFTAFAETLDAEPVRDLLNLDRRSVCWSAPCASEIRPRRRP